MTPNGWRIAVALAVAGHFGLHLALYNRLNALGLRRRTIKAIEKLLFVEMLITPVVAVLLVPQFFAAVWSGHADVDQLPAAFQLYGVICLVSWPVFGIPWLLWRPIFGLEWLQVNQQTQVVNVQEMLGRPLSLTRSCYLESRLPFNQIFELAIEQVELPVRGLPLQLDGFRIAQLSDIHLTGDIHPDYFRYAVDHATRWEPELMALTGDIVDVPDCLSWIPQIFADARAEHGCYFILGNHDTRLENAQQIRDAMIHAGWTDLGCRSMKHSLRGVPSLLIGNEYPWFPRPRLPESESLMFRLLLSHSPDQITWARQHQVQLMLSGHTHGGQGRLPLAGPLLSPSCHGSRFASGQFRKTPTTMHVSRGLSGVHLLRINCRPELSLLTLRAEQ